LGQDASSGMGGYPPSLDGYERVREACERELECAEARRAGDAPAWTEVVTGARCGDCGCTQRMRGPGMPDACARCFARVSA